MSQSYPGTWYVFHFPITCTVGLIAGHHSGEFHQLFQVFEKARRVHRSVPSRSSSKYLYLPQFPGEDFESIVANAGGADDGVDSDDIRRQIDHLFGPDLDLQPTIGRARRQRITQSQARSIT